MKRLILPLLGLLLLTNQLTYGQCNILPSFSTYNTSSPDVNNLYTGDVIYINNNFTVDEDMAFYGCTIYMAENTKIILQDASLLTLDGCTIEACDPNGNLWDGIWLDNEDEKLELFGTTIRNALTGVTSENGGRIEAIGSHFEGNYTGIELLNCTEDLDCIVTGCTFSPVINNGQVAPLLAGAPFNLPANGIKLSEVHAVSEDRFKIYPNPAQDFVSVTFEEIASLEPLHLRIYNMMGVEVKQMDLNFEWNKIDIDISDLHAGIYYYAIERAGKQIHKEQLVIID
jgi:hypothetical protein